MKTAYKAIYKVKKNDTLPIIGKVLGVNPEFIYYLNKLKIGSNPKIIQIAQELYVPKDTVIQAWNLLMGSDQVRMLTLEWSSQSKNLQKLINYSTEAYTEEQLLHFCSQTKLDVNIGKILWKMRIKNGMNPWKQISLILCQLIGAGLPNQVYSIQTN